VLSWTAGQLAELLHFVIVVELELSCETYKGFSKGKDREKNWFGAAKTARCTFESCTVALYVHVACYRELMCPDVRASPVFKPPAAPLTANHLYGFGQSGFEFSSLSPS